jgi:hypothetical protein
MGANYIKNSSKKYIRYKELPHSPMFAKLLRLDINVNKFELWSEKGWEQII